jgi:hypothetical protein
LGIVPHAADFSCGSITYSAWLAPTCATTLILISGFEAQ